jgi:hypothetical protein
VVSADLVDICDDVGQSLGNPDVLLYLCREVQLCIQKGEENFFF